MTGWEYEVVGLAPIGALHQGKYAAFQRILNRFGDDGWELVTIDRDQLGDGRVTVALIFKRPRGGDAS